MLVKYRVTSARAPLQRSFFDEAFFVIQGFPYHITVSDHQF
jgi:hypothetical protein